MISVKRALRVYADTSVFGGCFDNEFRTESVRFFEEVRSGRFLLVVSDVTLDELGLAPERWMPEWLDRLRATTLRTSRWRQSSAPNSQVSWNFKHIVHFEKIAGYEGVNSLRGYRSPKIYSPRAVVKN